MILFLLFGWRLLNRRSPVRGGGGDGAFRLVRGARDGRLLSAPVSASSSLVPDDVNVRDLPLGEKGFLSRPGAAVAEVIFGHSE